MMTNLLQETEECLRSYGKTFDDVLFVMGNGLEICKRDFMRIAAGFNYDGGYGHQYVPEDLMIVGDGWWLERGEYDGSEWWVYQTQPMRPEKMRELKDIDGDNYTFKKYVYADGGEA